MLLEFFNHKKKIGQEKKREKVNENYLCSIVACHPIYIAFHLFPVELLVRRRVKRREG